MGAEILTLPQPKFLKPIDDLLLKTVKKTNIQPARFEDPHISIPKDIQTVGFLNLQVNIPLPYPPPNGPFQVVVEHPYFGTIMSPVFVPHVFQENIRKKKKRRSKQKEKKKSSAKSMNETSSSIVQNREGNGSEIIEAHKSHFVAECFQKSVEHHLNQYLIYFKTVESRVNFSLQQSGLSEIEMNKLRITSHHLRQVIEGVENFYEEEQQFLPDVESSPTFQEILNCVSRLQTVLDKLTECKIQELLQQNVEKREEHMLCSILGLEDEVADFLIGLDPDIRTHQTDKYWILQFIEQKEKCIEEPQDVRTSLLILGFTASKASRLADKLKIHNLIDHQTLTYWAKLYIEHQFSYHILLASNGDGVYYPKENHDTEYFIPAFIDAEEDIEAAQIPAVNTKMLKEEDLHSSPWLTDYISQEGHSLDGSTLWFHGTDHESAMNIIKNGIDLLKGKTGGDFSDGGGFYLTSDYRFAHKWPQQMMKKPNSAVIVFEVKSDIFSSRKGLQFHEANEDWKNTVGFFRNGKDHKWVNNSSSKAKSLKRQSYILGPISRDGSEKRRQNWCPQARIPQIFELCLKDDLLAEDFYDSGNNIKQAIFFY